MLIFYTPYACLDIHLHKKRSKTDPGTLLNRSNRIYDPQTVYSGNLVGSYSHPPSFTILNYNFPMLCKSHRFVENVQSTTHDLELLF